MKWKEFVTDFLTFTRKDRIGILVSISLMLIIFLLPKALTKSSKSTITVDTAWISTAKKLEKKEPEYAAKLSEHDNEESYAYQYDHSKSNYYDQPQGELFLFDPNALSKEGWKKLGLKDKIIHTIQNYLSKGGHFKKKEDLQKIYGLQPEEYERLAPYIKIESIITEETNKPEPENNYKPYTSKYSIIDINTADTTAFISLPGIGNKLAARIVNFRDKLGGFYSVAQVGEIYGLPDSTFQKIKQYLILENTSIKKININTTTIDDLKAHPYIKWSIANPIIAYRNEHGPFSKVEDLKKVMVVTDEVYNKIAPYLITQ